MATLISGVLEACLSFVSEVLLYWTGRLVIPLATLGAVKVESLRSQNAGFDWKGVMARADGRRVVSANAASLWGLGVWLVAFVAGVVAIRAL